MKWKWSRYKDSVKIIIWNITSVHACEKWLFIKKKFEIVYTEFLNLIKFNF